jgi:hypothetical protein
MCVFMEYVRECFHLIFTDTGVHKVWNILDPLLITSISEIPEFFSHPQVVLPEN